MICKLVLVNGLFLGLKLTLSPLMTNRIDFERPMSIQHTNLTKVAKWMGSYSGAGWAIHYVLFQHYCAVKDLSALPHSFLQKRLMATTEVIISMRSLNNSLVCSAARPSKPRLESLEYSHQRQPMHHFWLPVHRHVCVCIHFNCVNCHNSPLSPQNRQNIVHITDAWHPIIGDTA